MGFSLIFFAIIFEIAYNKIRVVEGEVVCMKKIEDWKKR